MNTCDLRNFSETLKQFIDNECKNFTYPKNCILALAGAPKQNKILRFANIKIPEIDGNLLKKEFNFDHCVLVNDFKGVGYGLPYLKE